MIFYRKIFVILILLHSSCTHSVHLVHTSSFDPFHPLKKGKLISSLATQDVFMGLAFDTLYVEKAYLLLQKKCPKGDISDITTQYSTSHGFFSWTNKILMQGLCT